MDPDAVEAIRDALVLIDRLRDDLGKAVGFQASMRITPLQLGLISDAIRHLRVAEDSYADAIEAAGFTRPNL